MHIPTDHEVETFTGRFVDVKNPNPESLVLSDIAHALANTCRYGGHAQRYFSVAEHAVFVSIRLERKGYDLDLQIAGLHHDDAEGFLGDIPRPLKPLLGHAYVRLTDRMDAAIIEGLHLPVTVDMLHSPYVKDADNWSLFVEARHLLPSQGRGWWDGAQGAQNWGVKNIPSRIVTPDYWHGGLPPEQAESLFMARHAELIGKVSL